MDIADWQERLERTFGATGIVGALLVPVMAAENAYAGFVKDNFHGYLVLTDSFLSFFVQTFEVAETQLREASQRAKLRYYPEVLLEQAVIFRAFRAAENLLLCGYPLSGYALLRGLKDQAIILGAIGSGITTYRKVHGLDVIEPKADAQLTREDWRRVRNARTTEERRVFEEMLRSQSGIPPEHRHELARWQGLFHEEVHGGRLTLAMEGQRWLEGRGTLPILPEPGHDPIAMYLNRSNEAAWMLLRTLTLLQLSPAAFGEQWADKWRVLDDSFRQAVKALLDMGKKIASSVTYFIDAKMPFAPEKTFYGDAFEQ